MKPRKMEEYLAEAERFAEMVRAHRAARRNVTPVSPSDTVDGEPTPVLTKRKSYQLPLETPTPIPGFPLAPSIPGQDVPDYETMRRAKRLRRSGTPRLEPIGPPSLLKRHDVRTWKVAE